MPITPYITLKSGVALEAEYSYDADEDLEDRHCDGCDKPFRKGQGVWVGDYDPDTGSSHYCAKCAKKHIKAEG